VPLILSGGLTPDNVAEGIAMARPYAVDVASGVESSPGVKDPDKLLAFAAAVRGTAPEGAEGGAPGGHHPPAPAPAPPPGGTAPPGRGSPVRAPHTREAPAA
jgi:phosphoribosylanthranilate isomerase